MSVNQKSVKNVLAKEEKEATFLPLNLQFFGGDDEGGDDNGGSGGGEGDQSGGNEGGTDGSGDGQNSSEGKTKQGDNDGSDGSSQSASKKDNLFTQEDVNNYVAKQTKADQEKLLKQLGVKDFKTAKEGLAKLKKMQEDQLTDQEKLAKKAETLEQDMQDKDQTIQTLNAKVAVLSNGVKPDAVDDVTVLAKNLVDEDTDMDAAVKKVIEKYPHFAQEVKEEEPKQKKKPKFSEGDHNTDGGKATEDDKWTNAFKQAFGGQPQ